MVAGAVWANLPLGMHLQGRGLPKQQTLILIHPSARKGRSTKSMGRIVHGAPVLSRSRPLLTFRAQKADHYTLRVRIKARSGPDL